MKYGQDDDKPFENVSYAPLYKKASGGAIQEWNISVEGNVIVTRWGQRGGAVQETRDEIKKGKNIGKKNETTPAQQAALEAEAKHEKQLKKGYVKTLEAAQAGAVDEVIEGGVSPMLAHRFDEQGHKIKYPAFAQPKFDGHRCVAVVKDGKATLWSRTRKPITGLPHIIKDLEALSSEHEADFIFDGELYNHEYREKFEELTSFIRNPEPKPGHEAVQYHVYDLIPMNDAVQSLRFDALYDLLERRQYGVIVPVETIEVADEDELMAAFSRFLEQGYEGLMVRNAAGKYANKRSYDLQKVKEFKDDEFFVIGVEEGRGKLAGHAIFVCTTLKELPLDLGVIPADLKFRAKMKGETAKLKKYFDDPNLAIRKPLTVKFQGYTAYGVPRFPVGLRFKEDV